MYWVITLKMGKMEAIDPRLRSVISFILNSYTIKEMFIDDIDATGTIGNQLTQKKNFHEGSLPIDRDTLLTLLSEDGQIFDLNLTLRESLSEYQIITSRGDIVDILSNGERLPLDVTGDFEELDPKLFNR